jgi:hypothetical protein
MSRKKQPEVVEDGQETAPEIPGDVEFGGDIFTFAARQAYGSIWTEFAKDRLKDRAKAYVNLQQNMALKASVLVPAYFTATEHMKQIGEIEQYTKADQQSALGDPQQVVGDWLMGKTDLSRVPLDKPS